MNTISIKSSKYYQRQLEVVLHSDSESFPDILPHNHNIKMFFLDHYQL